MFLVVCNLKVCMERLGTKVVSDNLMRNLGFYFVVLLSYEGDIFCFSFMWHQKLRSYKKDCLHIRFSWSM